MIGFAPPFWVFSFSLLYLRCCLFAICFIVVQFCCLSNCFRIYFMSKYILHRVMSIIYE
jgi:hypothetical protein